MEAGFDLGEIQNRSGVLRGKGKFCRVEAGQQWEHFLKSLA
jgi:hypothetical protein